MLMKKRTKVILGTVGALVVVGAIGSVVNPTPKEAPKPAATHASTQAAPETETTTAEPAAESVPATSQAPKPAPATKAGVSDGDWTATDIQVREFYGKFGGTVRLTGPATEAGTVELSVLKGGSVSGVLNGFISKTSGGTQTVQLTSMDDYKAGGDSYDLKVTAL